ncbi:mechanosensitive ion channel family protein [Stakelama saccharophila]|uniref:Mechanosensitive ion channel family protein n=1 Tax=Stakelama saccharophila TaxID=3075605 RepID=A0ABZ0B6I7_9SPHN|nr:mechanosensitive ion channel family protein [Stakelama sp. W311]WNO52493.1 mechanosensitive ion channel family protein [Stakelama sp. W311]
MTDIRIGDWNVPTIVVDIVYVALAIGIALILHLITMQILKRVVRGTSISHDEIFLRRARRPLRWILVGLALALVREALHLSDRLAELWVRIAAMAVPLLVGWLAIAMVRAVHRVIELQADISVADNLRARQRRTRAAILTRIAIMVIGFITICLMLLSIPSVRSVGVTLMASAGLAALAVGAAAQPALKNLIAGIQMAFTEPIRLDDVVIVDGEWGRVEEIRLTYVIVAIWDERRLVVPVSRFLEDTFQNWTRQSSKLLGTVFLYLDPTADVDRIRAKSDEVIQTNPRWDGRAKGVQVTDARSDAIEVRILATAADAGTAFDLRCDIREAMLAFIRDEMPEALPRSRTELGGREWRSGGLELDAIGARAGEA